MTDAGELKPCPDPKCLSSDIQIGSGQPGCHWVHCRACGLQTGDKSRERASLQWNRLPRPATDNAAAGTEPLPMSSAPRDGSWIVGAYEGGHLSPIIWADDPDDSGHTGWCGAGNMLTSKEGNADIHHAAGDPIGWLPLGWCSPYAVSEAVVEAAKDAYTGKCGEWQNTEGVRAALEAALSQPTRTDAQASTEGGELERRSSAITDIACDAIYGGEHGWENMTDVEFAIFREKVRAALRNHEGPRTEADIRADEPQQLRVNRWAEKVFPDDVRADKIERSMRFLEEAAELCQSIGLTADKAHTVVDYVFGRPVGDPPQEVGGVMITLAVLCDAIGLDMLDCGEVELARIDTPEMREKIAAKQVSKRLFGMSGPSYDTEALKQKDADA